MPGSDCFFPASALLCQEDADACLSGAEAEAGDGIDCSLFPGDDDSCVTAAERCPHSDDPGDDDDYIEGLITRETTLGVGSRLASTDAADGNWLQNARTNAVRWIFRTHALFGFGPETAYLAVNFLDRFLVRRTIESRHHWAVQLLSMACLSVAAKLEEYRAPALSEFQLNEYQFDSKAIRRMELLLLATLEWRLRSVTPFPYLGYLVSRMKQGRSQPLSRSSIMLRATGALFAAIESMSSVDFRPSVMATAAFFAASGQALTADRVLELEREVGVVVASFSGSLQQDEVVSCYDAILESWNRKLMLGKKMALPAPVCDDSVLLESDDLDSTSADLTSTSIHRKRRRLALKGYSSCHCSISTTKSKNKSGPSIQSD